MKYYEVMLASGATAFNETLTYSWEQDLEVGQVVRVPLKKRLLSGVVLELVKRPKYPVKPMNQVIKGVVLPKHLIDLADAVAKYYAAPRSSAYSLLVPRGVHINRRGVRDTTEKHRRSKLPPLTKHQKQAIDNILGSDIHKTVLLHGDTGSGKTRVYMELAKRLQQTGRGSIILVPEIGLTTQLVQAISDSLDDVFIQHSAMTERERHLQWLQILRHPHPVVVGPRSALFAPLDASLIVVDESHEQTYKQDQTPKYHAPRVARLRADLEKARLVMGSATPSLDDYHMARSRDTPIVSMPKIAQQAGHQLTTDVVDMTTQDNRGNLISKRLEGLIRNSLKRGFQTMIFHNRRGSATSIICQSCGHIYSCPVCFLPLTHHQDVHQNRCHVCGYREKVSPNCVNCGSTELLYKGYGTKQLENELAKLFPTAIIARFDSDNLESESLNKKFEQLKSGEVDIIVGTQMIAKGLDLPKLEIIAIPAVDLLISLPDYSSSERFFQLVYQAMGRVGRHRDGQVILQTYDPKNPYLQQVLKKDYGGFFDNEENERKMANYPPFTFLLSLTVARKSSQKAQSEATKVAEAIKSKFSSAIVLGPAPAWREKGPGGYKWQLVVKSRDRNQLVAIARSLPERWQFDLDPISLLS